MPNLLDLRHALEIETSDPRFIMFDNIDLSRSELDSTPNILELPVPPPLPVTGRRATPKPKPAGALVYQMGIELTMMPPCLSKGGSDSSNDGSIARGYAGILQPLLRRDNIKYNDCDRDQKAVEVSSEILKTWSEVEKFYKSVSEKMLLIGLKPHVDECISGGGHLHFGKMPKDTMLNLMRDMQNRPWLNWIFNDPDDRSSSHSYATDLEKITAKLKTAATDINVNPALFGDLSDEAEAALTFYGNPKFCESRWLPDDKGKMFRYCRSYSTFEFRFFRAPLDWEEQKSHIQFAEAYIRWVEKEYKDKFAVTVVDTQSKVKAFTEEQSKKEFLGFLTVLGLQPEPYEQLLIDNLSDRFKRGERR